MYAKIFESIYEGSLVEDWKSLVVFQQLIVMCDCDGVIDMTPAAISRKTNIPLDIIKHGLNLLQQKDASSRTPDEEGRRIVLLDDHRDWGWWIVNHRKYRDLTDYEIIKEQNRERQRRYRANKNKKNGLEDACAYCGDDAVLLDHIVPEAKGGLTTKDNLVSSCKKCNESKNSRDLIDFIYDKTSTWVNLGMVLANPTLLNIVTLQNLTVTNGNAIQIQDTDTEVDTKQTPLPGNPDVPANNYKNDAKEILLFLNEKTGRNYQPVDSNIKPIICLLKDKATKKQIFQVIAKKTREWKDDPKMNEYLRPATLFNKTKFWNYHGELG